MHTARVWLGTRLMHLAVWVMPPISGMELRWLRTGLAAEVSAFMASERAKQQDSAHPL